MARDFWKMNSYKQCQIIKTPTSPNQTVRARIGSGNDERWFRLQMLFVVVVVIVICSLGHFFFCFSLSVIPIEFSMILEQGFQFLNMNLN